MSSIRWFGLKKEREIFDLCLRHSGTTRKASELLQIAITDLCDQKFDELEEISEKIVVLAREGDGIAQDARKGIGYSGSNFPQRHDLLDLLFHLERVLDARSRWFDWPRYFGHEPLIEEHAYFAPLEVFDRDGQTVVKLEVPGVAMEDIDISMSEGMLTIRGEKKQEREVKEEDYYHCERTYGSFRRTISIPAGIDTEKIAASYDDGVLELTLPKAEETKVKKIEAKAKPKAKPKAKAKAEAAK